MFGEISDVWQNKLTGFELNDPTLLHFDSFIENKWVESKSSRRFEVLGMIAQLVEIERIRAKEPCQRYLDPGTEKPWASCPTSSVDDVPAAVEA